MLVVDELHQPSPALAPLLEAIPASVTFRPFARPDSTRFPTVQTPKAGIFAAGPARGSLSLDVEEAEFDVLVSALSSANLAPAPRTFPGPPAIDRDKCAFCLTCVRICPHGAMGFHTIAQADPASCFRCGICVSECPMGAISLAPPGTAANVENPLEDAAEPALSGHIVAFLCARSAELARQDARLSASPSFKPVIVPCAGSVRTEQILDAFAGHAGGVLVAGCHPGNCASVQGTLLARERAQAIARFLTEAGYDSQRLLFTTLAANSRTDLVIAAETLRSRIRGSAGTLGGPQQ
jgi:coenzyme F420-reducing hydrogenase delta subunit/Pyruvate/2-oxoacid:ferredoxin oxidoreductase delta subunit